MLIMSPRKYMKLFVLLKITPFALTAALTACGGSNINTDPASPANATEAYAQTAGNANQPAPDCAADNCTVPRPVDDLAEQSRAAALERPAASPQDEAAADNGQGQALAPHGTDTLPAEPAADGR
jgi:hypothetical protein